MESDNPIEQATEHQDVQMRQDSLHAEQIVGSIPDPLLVLTLDLRVKTANDAFYEHFQVRPEDTEGRTIYEVGNGQWNIPSLGLFLNEGLSGNRVSPAYEITHDFKQVGARTLLVNGRRLDDLQLLLLVIRDITEQKQAEEALRESEKRYRAIFNTVGVSIWDEDFSEVKTALDALKAAGITDVRRYLEKHPLFVDRMLDLVRVRDVNEATLKMYGASSKEELLGSLRRIFLPEAMPVFREELMVLASDQSFLSSEVPVQTLQGERMVVTFTFTVADAPVYSHVLVSLLNITERQRAEDALKDLNERLEEHVEERTRQVRELMQALTLAEQVERQRIAQILHDDLQQHLYGLGVTLGMLRSPQSEAERRLHSRVREMLDKATNLTRTLSTELSPPILQSGGLEEMLYWLALRQKEMYGLDVALDVRGKPRVPEHNLRVLLYQVLREVLFNVVKHARVRHARLTAWEEAREVVVQIDDEGRGFDTASLQKHASRRDGGFGLSSVRERLQLAGGRFHIETELGRGTRVTLAVPIRERADP